MQKFEYKTGVYWTDFEGKKSTIEVDNRSFNKINDMINYMGEQGWQLKTTAGFTTTVKRSGDNFTLSYTNQTDYIFERAKS